MVKVTVLFLSAVCPSSKFSRSKIVSVSSVDGEAQLIFRIRNLKIEPIEPNLVGENVSVSLSAGEQRKSFQYSPTVNRARKKVKNVSLRHYHLPTLSSRINSVEHVDARKTIFTRNSQKI